MFYPGLVSISFRDHSPEEIIVAAKNAGLSCIEWGSDLHAPYDNDTQLERIRDLQAAYNISCCSYGTYFKLGFTPIDELPRYFCAAQKLGTNVLRVWAGRKKSSDCTPVERDHLFQTCKKAVALAEEHSMILCLECHRRSYTECKDGALELMEYINSPNFRMYWQPNPEITEEENLDYIYALQNYLTHIHVFHWAGTTKLPLTTGSDSWNKYLSGILGNHHLLLEFMPNDNIQSLPTEAETLMKWIQAIHYRSTE